MVGHYLEFARRISSDAQEFLIQSPERVAIGTPSILNERERDQHILRQLWTLVKMLRTVRMSCRHNTAFYNYLNTVFPFANFKDIPKENKFGKCLQITIKNPEGVIVSDDSFENGGDNDVD